MLQRPFPTFLKELYYKTFIVLHSGDAAECPICGIHLKRFIRLKKHTPPIPGNLCPRCRSKERHRLLWLFLKHHTDFFNANAKTILHVAPEPCFRERMESMRHVRYIVSDFESPLPQHHIDITNIALADESVDIILCNNVLEHIPDDQRAMRELARILKKGGWGIINVPLDSNRQTTFEDASIVTSAGRRRLYKQEDHVRIYGRDYPARLRESGFQVQEIDYYAELGEGLATRYALLNDEFIYFCTKTC